MLCLLAGQRKKGTKILQGTTKALIIFFSFSSPRFKKRFLQYNQTISETTLQEIDPKTLERIRELNRLDVELYEYAHSLLRHRFETLKAQDPHFDEHYENMGNINFSWENLN